MTQDFDLYGVFLPALFAWMLIAFVVSYPVRHLLAWSGFYRIVWHRPLFDIALYVVILGVVVLLTIRLLP